MSKLLFFISILFFGSLFGQEWTPVSADDILNIMSITMKETQKENQQIDFQRKMVAFETDVETIQNDKGAFYIGKKGQYRVELAQQLIIQNDYLKMIVDSASGQIYLTDKDSAFAVAGMDQLTGSRQYISQVLQKVSAKNKRYRFDYIPEFPTYESLEFSMSKPDNYLQEVKLYFREGNYISNSMEDETLEKPVLTVTYSTPKKLLPKDYRLFEFSAWIVPVSEGKFELTKEKSSRFELIDLRYQPSKK